MVAAASMLGFVEEEVGDVHWAVGDAARAREAWARALDIFRDLEHPDAATAHDRLHRLSDE